ncbi:MAG: TolC family protein [Oceanidesulfovibrio sp.]
MAPLVLLLLCVCAVPALAAEDEEDVQPYAPTEPLGFDDLLRLTLQQSPHLVASSVEIKVRRLDVWDSRANLLPDFFLTSTVRLNNPDDRTSKPFSFNFSFGNYDPIAAYFSIESKQLMTDYAVLEHLGVIDEVFASIGKIYLTVDFLTDLEQSYVDAIELARQNKAFATKRYNEGWGIALDVLIAEKSLKEAEQQREQARTDKLLAMDRLKGFLGLMPEQAVTLNLENMRRQLLGTFDSNTATLEYAMENSIELKQERIEVALQKDKLTLAYAKYLPNYTFGINREYSARDNTDIYLANIGFVIPLWDWGERYRNIVREKRNIRKARAEYRTKTLDFRSQFLEKRSDCMELADSVKLAHSEAEITALKKQKAEIQFKSGSMQFPKYIDALRSSLTARTALLSKEFEYDLKVFDFRQFTGHLYKSYVDAAKYSH